MKDIIYNQLKGRIQADLNNIAKGHMPDNYSNHPRPRLIYEYLLSDEFVIEGIEVKPIRVTVPINKYRLSAKKVMAAMKEVPAENTRQAIEEFVFPRVMNTNPTISPKPFIKEWAVLLSDFGRTKEDFLIVMTIGEIEICSEMT